MIIHPYKYIHLHSTSMSTSKKLSRLELEIHKVGHQERIAVDETSSFIERIINRKYNTYVKYII
jgi:hypothetical protein